MINGILNQERTKFFYHRSTVKSTTLFVIRNCMYHSLCLEEGEPLFPFTHKNEPKKSERRLKIKIKWGRDTISLKYILSIGLNPSQVGA